MFHRILYHEEEDLEKCEVTSYYYWDPVPEEYILHNSVIEREQDREIKRLFRKPLLFKDYFAVRPNHSLTKNYSIERRILTGLRRREGEECIEWIKKTPYVSVAGKQIHCRKLIYDYCVGSVREDETVGQKCNTNNNRICLNPNHMIKYITKTKNLHKKSKIDMDPFWKSVIEKRRESSTVQKDTRQVDIEIPADDIRLDNALNVDTEEEKQLQRNSDNRDEEPILSESILMEFICDSQDRQYKSDSDLSYIHGSSSEEEEPDQILLYDHDEHLYTTNKDQLYKKYEGMNLNVKTHHSIQ